MLQILLFMAIITVIIIPIIPLVGAYCVPGSVCITSLILTTTFYGKD